MRTLAQKEMEHVTGGFNVHVNLWVVEIETTGSEIRSGYNYLVNRTADFFTWWDPAGYYR